MVGQVDMGRERRSLSQEDGGLGVKRFKSTLGQPGGSTLKVKPTSTVGQVDGTGLKIRISRYSAAPGRSQQQKPDINNLPHAGGAGGEAAPPPTATPLGARARTASSPRTSRRTRRSSSEQILEEVRGDHPVKQERDDIDLRKVNRVNRQCEVKLNSLEAIKMEDISSDSDDSEKRFKHPQPSLDIGMTGREIVDECERVGPGTGPISTSVFDRFPIPRPLKRAELPRVSKENLLPPTPCVYIRTAQEAFSPQLMDWCLQRPITMVRGLAKVCGIDLGLYTTKTLVEMHPNHPVEIRSQLEQSSDENWDPTLQDQVWYCTSSRSHTTVAKYAEYQATSFKEAKEEMGDKFSVNPKLELKNDPDTGLPVRRTIKFGTNCDLSDEKKWKPQIQELMKLPAWMRCVSVSNMLSHVGHQILGMNTPQLYIKVPCSRTPGHQENNNFCGANINVGPGNSEWFGVPNDYWGALQELCAAKNVDYLHGSWWPKIEDLLEAEIPCYRFMQGPGDMVWVNSGCVHWVQAAGWCTNVAWNVGPISARSYRLGIERYEWNKTQRYQSIVAMVYLTWNLARNICVTDVDLYRAMKLTMLSSIRCSVLLARLARNFGRPVRYHGHRPHEPANYCMVCEEEVFNTFFVRENEKKHVVHCGRCAREQTPNLEGWVCLEEYDIEELLTLYDNFVLGGGKEEKLDQQSLCINNNEKVKTEKDTTIKSED